MKNGKKETDAIAAAEGTMSTTPTAVVLDFLAEAERFYRAGEIEQACFRAFRAFHFSTFLPNWPPVDGRPYDRSALFDILDQERPDRLPLFEPHFPRCAIAFDRRDQLLRQGVDHAGTDAVEAAGGFVVARFELAAGPKVE